MDSNIASDWRDCSILMISDDHTNLVDMLQQLSFNNLQLSSSDHAISILQRASKGHTHFEVVLILQDYINQPIKDLLHSLRTEAVYRFPFIIVVNESEGQELQSILKENNSFVVSKAPKSESDFEELIKFAYQAHQSQKQNLLARLVAYKPKILVVEDDLINQKVFKIMLDSFNCQYDLVSTGKDALNNFKKNPYDIILLDIGLPDIDGFEVTKLIRADEKSSSHLPVIAVTAFISNKTTNYCQEVGMDDIIIKPVMLPSLQYAIACNLLNRI